jgi:ABC-type glycerol-3-phosphate transport system permease component
MSLLDRGVGRTAALYGGGLVLLAIGAFPLLWMLSTSLKPSGEIFATPPTLVPRNFTLENFARLFAETSFLMYFWNSVAVSLATVLLTLAVSVSGAYGLTRFIFPGREKVADLILVTYMFAPIMIIIPFYILVRQLGLVNTRTALVLSYTSFCLPFCLWLLRAFFEGIPSSSRRPPSSTAPAPDAPSGTLSSPSPSPASSPPASSPSSSPGTTSCSPSCSSRRRSSRRSRLG